MAGYPYGATDTTHAQPYYYDSLSAHGREPELAHVVPEVGFKRGLRRRMSFVPIILSLLIPWAFFCVLLAILSFQIRYNQPWLCYLFVGLGLVAVALAGCVVVDGAQRKLRGDPRREPTWFVFLFLSMLLAWTAAMIGGGYNYYYNTKPFHDVQALETYVSVDPDKMRGEQLMDGGRVTFVPGARLDITKSMGFKRTDMYCVAPVTTVPRSNDTKLETYDFWAVGMNCCSGTLTEPNYHCGQFANAKANGGLRLMSDDERPFYRLAVQQAEAAYNIKASHPLFYTWVADPTAETLKLQTAARQFCLISIFAYFVVQLFLVAVTTVFFSKFGKP